LKTESCIFKQLGGAVKLLFSFNMVLLVCNFKVIDMGAKCSYKPLNNRFSQFVILLLPEDLLLMLPPLLLLVVKYL